MKKCNKTLLTLSIIGSLSSFSFAGLNKGNSGVVASISGGVVTSRSSGEWTSVINNTYDYTSPITTGGTGSLRVGYLFAFGDQKKDEFYFSVAGRYNLLGNVASNIGGAGNVVTYSQNSISQFGVELAIGKYWNSPFYTDLYINPGATNNASAFIGLGARAGYDIVDNLSIYAEGSVGGQMNSVSTIFDMAFGQLGGSGTVYATGQIGLQYIF